MSVASRLTAMLSVLSVILAGILFLPNNAGATSCKDVTLIFARGSGASLNVDENQQWERAFRRQLGQTKAAFYELGSQSIDGYQYPAVNVSDLLNGNAIGAKVTGGAGNDYGKSVMQGVQELVAYIRQTNQACPNMKYILGGYSQGAQVMSQGVQYLAPQNRDRILFLATFGDPKLRLPEGDGLFYVPACDGKNFSPWRRVVDNCRTNNGSLGGWNPYVPDDMRNKTWTWCYARDFVCGADLNFTDNSGHGRYSGPGMAIDDAANEATKRLNDYLKSVEPTVEMPPVPAAAPKPNDVALVIDTTGSMGRQIEATKALATDIANRVIAAGGRIALTEYRDFTDDIKAEVRCGLTKDAATFAAAVNALSVDGGGDDPEGLLHALMTTYNTLQWQQGASKAAIVITDDTYHNPDLIDGSTMGDVVKRSLEIDPVNTYVITNQRVANSYQDLANGTAGKVIINDGSVSAAIMDALHQVLTRPTAQLPLTGYEGPVGTEFKFDASMSSIQDSTIISYEWDFNGDGTFDRTTTSPVVYHTYPDKFDGNMQVRVIAANGSSSSASATVKVGQTTQLIRLSPAQGLTVSAQSAHEVTVSWRAPIDSAATKWIVMFNGVRLGYAAASQTRVTITDVDRTIPTEYGVMAADDEGRVSDWAMVTLPSDAPAAGGAGATSEGAAPNRNITQPNSPTMAMTVPAITSSAPSGSDKPIDGPRSEPVTAPRAEQSPSSMPVGALVAGGMAALLVSTLWYWRRMNKR